MAPILGVFLGLKGLGALYDVFNGKQALRSLVNADQYFQQYTPEQKEKMVQDFRNDIKKTGVNIKVDDETKNDINAKMQSVKTHFDAYKSKITDAIHQATLKEEKNLKIDTLDDLSNFENSKLRLSKDIKIFEQLVNDMGNSPQYYGPEDIMSRPYRIKQRISTALDKEHKAELEALEQLRVEEPLKAKLTSVLKTTYEEQKSAVLKPMDEAITALQDTVKINYDREFFVMQQWQQLKELKNKMDADNRNNTDARIGTDNGDFRLEILDLNIPGLAKQLQKHNEENNYHGDDQLTLKAKNGQKLTIKNTSGDNFSLEFDLPRRLFSPFYYADFHSNIKSSTMDAISMYIASGHIAKGNRLELYVTHDDEKTAIESAREQYLAAIESGLQPDKHFYMKINGVEYKNDQIMQHCFSKKDDRARLSQSQGIAQRNAQKYDEKWQAFSNKHIENTTNKADGWKESKAYQHQKEIKAKIVQGERINERKKERADWNKESAPININSLQ